MKYAFAVLALLLCTSPASAKTLVVRCESVAGDNDQVLLQQFQTFSGLMNRRGGTFNDILIRATRTLWMQTGLQVWGTQNSALAATEQFDAVVIFNYQRATTLPAGTSLDSLTLVTKWPSVPVVFIGAPTVTAGKWTSSATCSTGVKTLGTAYSSVRRTYVMYPVGSTNPWKSLSLTIQPVVAGGTYPTGTAFRPVVAMNYSSVAPGGEPVASSILRTDADSTGYTSAGNDSIVLWVRTMTPTAAFPAPKPLIFVEAGTSPIDPAIMAMAMQMADSASGGNVWDADDAKPIQAGFAVTTCASRGKYTAALDANGSTSLGGGVFCYADSCDSTNVLGGLDSLGTLGGLKTTFYVDPCSLATYPSVKNWLYRAGKYKVGMQPISGTFTSITTRADSTFPADPLGRLRQRNALPDLATSLPFSCSPSTRDTASIYCGVRRGFNIIRNHFGDGLVDRSILPAFSDWTPVAYTRSGGGPGLDSTAWALWHAGVRSIVIRPEWINNNPNVSSFVNAGVATQYPAGGINPAADPYGYGPEVGSLPVYADPANKGRVIGQLKIVAERGQRTGPNVSYTDPAHDIRNEWLTGLVQDNSWYVSPIRYYYHSFWTRTQVLSISLGSLGGAGVTAGAIGTGPARIGWWMVKHTANQFNAANNLGWVDANGRQRHVFDWAFIEDLEP